MTDPSWPLVTAPCRVIIEKPVGHDLASAQELLASLDVSFPALREVLFVDHYLGKQGIHQMLEFPALTGLHTSIATVWPRRLQSVVAA